MQLSFELFMSYMPFLLYFKEVITDYNLGDHDTPEYTMLPLAVTIKY